jgi:hypothetical protein
MTSSARMANPLKMHEIQSTYFARPGTTGEIPAARRDKIAAVSAMAGAFDAWRQWLRIQIVGNMTTARHTPGLAWIRWFGQRAIGTTYDRSQSRDGHA